MTENKKAIGGMRIMLLSNKFLDKIFFSIPDGSYSAIQD
jgi:hypothetical protein